MAAYEVIVKRLEPMRVVAVSENLVSVSEIEDACGRMYPQLHAALARHRLRFDGLSLAIYEDIDDEDRPLRLTTVLRVPGGVTIEGDGLTTIELAAVERAATTVVRGVPEQFAMRSGRCTSGSIRPANELRHSIGSSTSIATALAIRG